MFPKLTSRNTSCSLLLFTINFHNIILDYAKRACLNFCLNINLCNPVINLMQMKYKHGLCQQTMHAVNQMQVRMLGNLAVWQKYFLTSKIPHKEENKLPRNSEIQATNPKRVSLRLGKRRLTCANRRKGLGSIRLPNFSVNESLPYFRRR